MNKKVGIILRNNFPKRKISIWFGKISQPLTDINHNGNTHHHYNHKDVGKEELSPNVDIQFFDQPL